VFQGPLNRGQGTVIDIAATEVATEMGNPLVASMVMTGAYAAATKLVGIESVIAAVPAALPPYRSHLAEANVAAVRAGHAMLTAVVDAWGDEAVPT
jgi:Pyruvate/2-oxoacid:ferredoxin oxidoreductase gamma subunit